jgi:CheY-like chemotaxis protein
VPDPDADKSPPERSRADLAHELGNRLASIVAFSHLIRTDARLPQDLHDQADLLVQEADRTRAIVEEILERQPPPGARVDRPPTASSAVPVSPDGVSPTILVVDDEPAIRDFLTRILRRIGYEPVVASDGIEALAIVRTRPPDAILCDHRMAGMTGAAFNDAVAEISPGLARRFAFMTGDVANPSLRSIADDRGVVLLAKPFDIESVERTVEQILGR